ncbi:TIGR00730 family Rossman fold protein [Streptomyces sp. NPDC023998]|uniref:LOG family protein n=1 Tax=Streptomyces sp. NPDC023998 TaxID=3154597 RepID=UPI0033F2F406
MSAFPRANEHEPSTLGGLSICVFCGARDGKSAAALHMARDVGTQLGIRGHSLIYGGGGIGMMGEVARSARAAGAHVTGIVPGFLRELERAQDALAHTMLVTHDMFDRKRRMIDISHGFIALPGGYGTLDEVMEVVSLAYLGQCLKPLVLVDVDGTWDQLLALFEDVDRRGFVRSGLTELVQVVPSAAEAVAFIEQSGIPATTKEPVVTPPYTKAEAGR